MSEQEELTEEEEALMMGLLQEEVEGAGKLPGVVERMYEYFLQRIKELEARVQSLELTRDGEEAR